jgi:hypothetical protein
MGYKKQIQKRNKYEIMIDELIKIGRKLANSLITEKTESYKTDDDSLQNK